MPTTATDPTAIPAIAPPERPFLGSSGLSSVPGASVAGALPWEVLGILNDYYWDRNGYRRKEN